MDEISQFSIRIPQDIRQYLHEEANKKGRSLNYEIVRRLTQSVDNERSLLVVEEVEDYLHPRGERGERGERGDITYVVTEGDTEYQLICEIKRLHSKIDYLSSEKYSANLFKMALRYFFEKSEKK